MLLDSNLWAAAPNARIVGLPELRSARSSWKVATFSRTRDGEVRTYSNRASGTGAAGDVRCGALFGGLPINFPSVPNADDNYDQLRVAD